jgi:hypothetical protein
MNFIDYLTKTALSMTISGNTGISPFLTLLLLGVVEVANPELLNMGETMEAILASWYSIAILSILTLCELIGKCIPAVDEIIDSVEVFVVPALSVLATMGTVGVFDAVVTATTGGADEADILSPSEGERNLGEVSDGFLTAWKVFLVLFGIVLSLLIHFFKMIIRVVGLVCCMGCCQPCITIIEATIVCCGVVFAILVGPIAIVLCAMFLIAATYALIYKCRQRKDNAGQDQATGNNTNNTTSPSNVPMNPSPGTMPNSQPATIPAINDTKGNQPTGQSGIPSTAKDNGPDVENPSLPPPVAPSAPQGDEPVTYAEVTPMAPPAVNPNFVPSDKPETNAEIPIAVAVEVVTPHRNDDPKSNPKNSAIIY